MDRFAERALKSGRSQHFYGPELREFSESKNTNSSNRQEEEGAKMLSALPPSAYLIAMDETGKDFSSLNFARYISRIQDEGTKDLVFAIGGPDGHGQNLKSRANQTFSMGSLTWPHQLARIMLCEQIYRAMTILSGHPYHRQ